MRNINGDNRESEPAIPNAPDDILVIDDEPVIRATFKHMLEEEGYRVWVAGDGREGLRLFRQKRPKLIITDIVMPELDGSAVIEALQKESPEIPIIAMSAIAKPEQMDRPIEGGAYCYLTKPVDMPVLLDIIRAILTPGPDIESQKNAKDILRSASLCKPQNGACPEDEPNDEQL